MEENNNILSFDSLDLNENLLRGIYSYGFEQPTPIQIKAIPIIKTEQDIIAQSQSGTGKTGAFVIGTLQRIDDSIKGCQAMIIAHTRELAQQIYEFCTNLCIYMDINPVLCIGGQNIHITKNELLNGTTIAIGTPGRLIDLIHRGYLSTRILRLLIIDEADEMFSTSFQEQLKNIIKIVPNDTQVCLFSATLPPAILELTKRFMNNPTRILIEKELLTLEGIKQFYVNVENEAWKFDTFCDLYDTISISQSIIYVNSIRKGVELKQKLEEKSFTVLIIHSGMESSERIQVMKEFRNGSSRILISTDLLARGIDIQQISVVINYDLPRNKENYLHRIGRSGRFGRKGIAINLITTRDETELKNLMIYYETEIVPLPENIEELIQ